MGRGKREIKKIANAASRQVTFFKRRGGLFKKAKELAVLCDASVGVIVISATGKLYSYSSSNMKMILEKYLKYPEVVQSVISSSTSVNALQSDDIAVANLSTQYERLHQLGRQMNGKELKGLSLEELKRLEENLEIRLKGVRSRQNELLLKQMDEFQKKEKEIQEENTRLRQQLHVLLEEEESDPKRERAKLIEFDFMENNDSQSDCTSAINLQSNDNANDDNSEKYETSLQLGLFGPPPQRVT